MEHRAEVGTWHKWNFELQTPSLMTQMTVGMPLAGFYRIIMDEQHYVHFFATEKAEANETRREEAKEIERKFAIWATKHPDSWVGAGYTTRYAQETALGFLCVVQAFISVARENNPEQDNSFSNMVALLF
jgi:hypothetical protein